ncbi:hypothetical protein V8E51_013059 [Hyaloscypha variabilis]
MDSPPTKPSLRTRLGLTFRSKSHSNKLTKLPPSSSLTKLPSTSAITTKSISSTSTSTTTSPISPKPRPLAYGAIYRPTEDNTNTQTGERRDDTDLLHGLMHRESNSSLDSAYERLKRKREEELDTRPPGEEDIAKLPSDLWAAIAGLLSPCDAASLVFASKVLKKKIGNGPWEVLNRPEGLGERVRFLGVMDGVMPGHLLCFLCGRYHVRTQIGKERLKAASVLNPLYECPSIGKPGVKPYRTRITPGHTLPFTFVQLVLRARKFGASYGMDANELGKRYKDPYSDWMHQTRYYIHKGHLLLRVVSRSFANPDLPPSGQRHLLYSREDYTPYFSVCAHWRDGELMNVCKCALGHIPKHRQTIAQQMKRGPQIQNALRNPNPIVTLCSFCRPMRRCPECPSEYLVELKLAEDKNDPLVKFKQAITVTRWCDLGNGSSPFVPEWAAINGEGELYDSFANMGRRAISGIFESQSGVTIPGQRMLSLNPKNEKLGEEGHSWY